MLPKHLPIPLTEGKPICKPTDPAQENPFHFPKLHKPRLNLIWLIPTALQIKDSHFYCLLLPGENAERVEESNSTHPLPHYSLYPPLLSHLCLFSISLGKADGGGRFSLQSSANCNAPAWIQETSCIKDSSSPLSKTHTHTSPVNSTRDTVMR